MTIEITPVDCVQAFGGHVFGGPCLRCGTEIQAADPRYIRHVFTGRSDRYCTVCGLPDRDPVHNDARPRRDRVLPPTGGF